ncbi:MAG: hypothetical protein ACRDLZ_07840 [Gaiellaceae bacterium]
MRRKLPLAISIAALVVALLGATGPAVAHGVRHALFAHNAGKVDGRSAVGTAASVNSRKGKLVATSGTSGRLPNNIIAKAPDADLLDGLDSAEFLGVDGKAADADSLDGLDSTEFIRSGAATGDLTGTYPNLAIADGAVTTGKLAPDVGLGFFTGRVNDLDTIGTSWGPASGLSQSAGHPADVWSLSPDRGIRMRELAARPTIPPNDVVLVLVAAWEPIGRTLVGFLGCVIPPGASECTNAGPSTDVIPPRSLLAFQVVPQNSVPLPSGTDVLFSWRAQAP